MNLSENKPATRKEITVKFSRISMLRTPGVDIFTQVLSSGGRLEEQPVGDEGPPCAHGEQAAAHAFVTATSLLQIVGRGSCDS